MERDQGANVDRYALSWSGVEPNGRDCEPGGTASQCNLAPYDSIYTALTGASPGSATTSNPNPVRPVILITDAPAWAVNNLMQPLTMCSPAHPPNAPCAPTFDHYQDYANFAATVAKRYPLAAAIEVWNEENGGFWDPCCNPAGYAQLLKDTYQAVHPLTQDGTVKSDMKVLLGGLAGCTGSGGCDGNVPSAQFLADVYAAWGTKTGTPAYMDGIGLHPYPGRLAADGQDRVLDEMRDVRDDYGDSARPIYITETGISTTPSSAEPNFGNTTATVAEPVDEADQATMVAQLWNSLSPQPDIAAVLMHTDIGLGDPTSSPEPGFGLLDNDANHPQPGVTAPPPGGTAIGWRASPYRVKPAFCVNAQLHAGSPYSDSYQCPSGIAVPSLTAQPASGNWQAQTDLQAAYEVSRGYFDQNGTFTGITNQVLYNGGQKLYGSGPTLISYTAPTSPSTNNPGANADPSQIDIVAASGTTLRICNSGTGDTSYCIVRTQTGSYATPYGCSSLLGTCSTVAATSPNYQEAVKSTTGDRAALNPPSGTPLGWSPPGAGSPATNSCQDPTGINCVVGQIVHGLNAAIVG